MSPPEFPDFKPLQLEDRDWIHPALWKYQPETSEWTFTNLFVWRAQYHFQWCTWRDWLVFICTAQPGGWFAFQPIGPPSRLEITRRLLEWLRDEKGEKDPRIERADRRLVREIEGNADFSVEPLREHFDYIYLSSDLIRLAGRKYHAKRNHVNKFTRSYTFTYAALDETHIDSCLELSGRWCESRRCAEDLSLLREWDAVREALTNFAALANQGGVILIQNKVEAFTIGERLNEKTAVVHIEKANPAIPELYAMINQQFSEHQWKELAYVNREQDLGDLSLRQSKESYHPDHFAEKFRIRLRE